MKKTEKPDKERKTIRFRSFSSSVESKTQKCQFPLFSFSGRKQRLSVVMDGSSIMYSRMKSFGESLMSRMTRINALSSSVVFSIFPYFPFRNEVFWWIFKSQGEKACLKYCVRFFFLCPVFLFLGMPYEY